MGFCRVGGLLSSAPAAPFCLETLERFLRRFPHPMAERVEQSGGVSRLFQDDSGRLIALKLDLSSEGALTVSSSLKPPPEVSAQLEHVFEFASPLRAELARHPRAAWLGESVELPVLRWENSFAALISSVIEQQTSWRNALRSIDLAFRKSRRRAGALALFPSPEEFLGNPELLEAMPITNRRKELIRSYSGLFLEEPDFLDKICFDLAAAESRLTAITGIGPWTARVFLSKRYGYRAHVPTNDVALQRAAAHFILGESRKMTETELAEALEEFGDLAGEAAHRMLIRWVLETYG